MIFKSYMADRLWIEMRKAVPVVSQASDAVSLVRNNRTCILSPPCPHACDSVTSNLDYLTAVTGHLDRDVIDAPNGFKTDDVLWAIDIAVCLTELDLPFSDRRTVVNFIVALQLWATNPTKEEVVRNDRLSEYLHQYEVDVGGDPDE